MLEFLKKTEEFVEQYEADLLDVDLIEADQAQVSADKCGCPNCLHLAWNAMQHYLNQLSRISSDFLAPKNEDCTDITIWKDGE